ncbi:MAG: pitrilysin family protein [Patescibacteria group bacterium]|jgi:predicted Zn-dependent peptidase|nr:pitrilysin family protein [Patescibacteria group bacterium]
MVKKTKLKNGLNLITAPLKETKAVTVLVLVPVGSRYESKDLNGVSHFIEHLMFKGTVKRPTSLDLTRELDAVGAEYNAFTAKDHTGYYIKVSREHLELAFDILSDMLFNSKFDGQEIDKERGVIIEEINMYHDNPLLLLASIFEQTVFGDHPLGRLISGPKEVIQKVSRQKILAFKNNFYQAKNLVLAVSGNITRRQVSQLADKYFSYSGTRHSNRSYQRLKINQSKPQLNLVYRSSSQVQLGLGFLAYSFKNTKIYPLYLLSVILGGNMSSRLFLEVRERRGLAYFVKSDVSAYEDVGTLMIQAGLDKARIKQAIEVILAELRKLKDHGVSAKELNNAKEFLKGKMVLDLEDSEHIADWYAKQKLFFNNLDSPEERLKKIFAVSKKQVLQVANDLIKKSHLNLVLIGPFKNKQEFIKILDI